MKFRGILKLTYTVEAKDSEEAKQKVNWLINEQGEDGFFSSIKVVELQ